MGRRTVDWTALRPQGEEPEGEGLRERKKRRTRQQLSDTATTMFLERGFDAVRVSEIAEACGVSEKTVFNYFPTKEALVLDRWQATTVSLRNGLAEPGTQPVRVVERILAAELGALTGWLAAQQDPVWAGAMITRFGALLRSTPSLRAHQYETTDRLVADAAEALARRAGVGPDDPEPRIAATALLGLWQVQARSLSRHLSGGLAPDQVHAAVTADVRRAAGVIAGGLDTFAFDRQDKEARATKAPGADGMPAAPGA
ncbi:TetR family transcriptional regulator [Streptacidiphilus sp. P02-A3a]|nr:TetR family transcriptional regulator [Streptacidiphilus sp. P02-A3a]